jgi:hypothetical protein
MKIFWLSLTKANLRHDSLIYDLRKIFSELKNANIVQRSQMLAGIVRPSKYLGKIDYNDTSKLYFENTDPLPEQDLKEIMRQAYGEIK